MRELGSLSTSHDAQVLVDYLLTQKIPAVVRTDEGQAVVWVRDEDDLERAKLIWSDFRSEPKASKYRAASKPAQELRKLKEKVDKAYAAKYKDEHDFWGRPHPQQVPFTIVFTVLSIIATVWTNFDTNRPRLLQLTFTDQEAIVLRGQQLVNPDVVSKVKAQQLEALQRGELWRLVTPIFLHFSVAHLVFNMYAFYSLGGLIERRRGSLWFILFVLLTGMVSNVIQFFLPHLFDLYQADHTVIGASLFGGMSGVCYALFGYLVSKTVYAPEPGLLLPKDTIVIMLLWLVLCMTGRLGNIANTAHVAGLIIGGIIGAAPRLLKQLRNHRQ